MNRALWLLAIIFPLGAAAQTSAASTATPTDTTRWQRYLFAGGGTQDVSALDEALRGTPYPALAREVVYQFGVGFQADAAKRIAIGFEMRGIGSRRQRDADKAYTRLNTLGLAILPAWHALRTGRWVVDLVAGPEFQLTSLVLRQPDSLAATNPSFAGYAAGAPDKRTLFQRTLSGVAGVHIELRSKREKEEKRDRWNQLGIGLRVLYNQQLARSRWVGTDTPGDLDDARLGRSPRISPAQWSVVLIFSDVFTALPATRSL